MCGRNEVQENAKATVINTLSKGVLQVLCEWESVSRLATESRPLNEGVDSRQT